MTAHEINRSQVMMLRQAVREMDKSNFTKHGIKYHKELLALLDAVDTWSGGVVIHTEGD